MPNHNPEIRPFVLPFLSLVLSRPRLFHLIHLFSGAFFDPVRFSLRDCASLGLVEPHLLGVARLRFGPHPRLLLARPEDREEHGLQPEDAQRNEEDDPPGLHGLLQERPVQSEGTTRVPPGARARGEALDG